MTTPYGAWTSPISVEDLTSATTGLSAPTADGTDLYWLESRPDQGGRTSLWRLDAEGARTELTPDDYVRTMVHEYGGGAYDVSGGVVAFSSLPDNRVYRLVNGEKSPLTSADSRYRYADLRVHPEANLVLAIREDHAGGDEPVNTIVAIKLDEQDQLGQVLCSGADFYATPELSTTGRLAWIEWDHPNMPWDSTRLLTGQLGAELTDVELIAGGPGESVGQPRWTPDQKLIFVSDRTGWWNLYLHSDSGARALHERAAEFAPPQWVHGINPYAVIDQDTLLCSFVDHGLDRLAKLTISSGELQEIDTDATVISGVSVGGSRAILSVGYADQPAAIVTVDLDSLVFEQVRTSSDTTLDPALISIAEAVTWDGEQGEVHGWFYPPTNPDCTAPEGTLPPLITMSHGGPTSMAKSAFAVSYQYWTSRGFAILDVNYGGSTGYGRDYRERLKGAWGFVDVDDCASGALAMSKQGRVDSERLAIIGGSAGGYTTLRALTETKTFTAGISLYGVGDLEALARDTHKFESRYLDGLIGPYPQEIERYQDRSPINHVDGLSCPVLLLQGLDDKVVPPNQAESMAAAARAKGLPVALIMFEGEGHGFRKAETIKAAIEAELFFYGRIFGFTPADEIAPITIENLRTDA